MTWILWVAIAVLWTVVVFGFGCLSGIYGERERAKKHGEATYDKAMLHGPVGSMGATGATGPSGDPGPPGPPGPAADVLGTELTNGMVLREWIAAVDSRFTRVERRAGMSV